MASKAGFIGLGAMGLPMTKALAAEGISMVVHDPDSVARDRAAALDGVRLGESAADVAGDVGVLFTCLPNDAVVRAAYLDDGGIVGAMNRDGVTVDCSTVSPTVSRDLYDALAEKGVSHVDASMLGSVPQAETGEIGFVVGGDRSAYERLVPLLDILGRIHWHVGPSGAGNRVKLIHQTLVAGHAVAVAEALALCLATETDIEAFYDVVCNGGGFAYSRYFEKRVPRMRAGDFSPLFMLELMDKDAGLARAMARDAAVETPLLDQILAVFAHAKEKGWSREDFSAVARVYEDAIGRKLVKQG